MDSKIQELTNKLLTEGVEKGKVEAEKIIAEANNNAALIIEDAKKQAQDILNAAKKDSQALNDNTKSELKMFTEQAINALKSEIANAVSDKVVKESVSKVVADKDFMQKFVLQIAQNWGADKDIVISTEDAEGLKAYFAKEAKDLLDKGLKINQVHGQDALFSIQPADGSYKVNFGEKEFENYFKSFLRPQLVEMLF